ncbi:hypothetical protein ACFY3V_36450 [Streptosporangium sp. NPDC000095]|uniref:hypothetical protein n=1 Tax=Streptosporangium sp. NPDC000095 TaxID=3366184 RepID=UPI00368BE1BD
MSALPGESMNATSEPRNPLAGLDLTPFAFTRRCWVDATPDAVYHLAGPSAGPPAGPPSPAFVSGPAGDGGVMASGRWRSGDQRRPS